MAPPLLDVRNAGEFLACRIPGSLHTPESDTKGLLVRVEEFDRVVLVCDDGQLGAMVARALNFSGHHGVKYLEGGLSAWNAAGGGLVETTETGAERPLARFRESKLRSLANTLAGACSARLFGIALVSSAVLLASLLLLMR